MAMFMVKPWYKKSGGGGVPSWSTGTDAEIVSAIAAADRGEIDLTDYWNIGDERKVQLSAMTATGTNDYGSWTVNEAHVAQEVTLVLMDIGKFNLVTPVLDKQGNTRTTCSFVVGQKNCLSNGTTLEDGYMNATESNEGSWNGCQRRTWCNTAYRGAIPSTLLPIFKQFEVDTIEVYNGSTLQTSQDYFALFAEKEIYGERQRSNSVEADALQYIEYYKTVNNRIKKAGDSGSNQYYWERSPYDKYRYHFCVFYSSTQNSYESANYSKGIAPFGCI